MTKFRGAIGITGMFIAIIASFAIIGHTAYLIDGHLPLTWGYVLHTAFVAWSWLVVSALIGFFVD